MPEMSPVEHAPTSPSPAVLDPARLEALRRTLLLDSAAEENFDRLTRLATKILQAPVALVSLVDENRQFFKSCVGLPEPWATRRETPLSHSFCQHTLASHAPLIIEDAREHPLVRDNLAIPDLNVIAYAGIPLVTREGYSLGSFCVIDSRPRRWTTEEISILQDLAASVVAEIELRLANIGIQQYAQELRASDQRRRFNEALLRRVATNMPGMAYQYLLRPDGSAAVPYASDSCRMLFGVEPAAVQDDAEPLLALLHPDDRADFDRSVKRSAEQLCPWQWEGRYVLPSGEQRWVEAVSRPERLADGSTIWDGVLIDITEHRREQEHRQHLLAELAIERARLQAVLDQMPSGVMIAEAPSGRLILGNPQVERIWRYPFFAAEDVEGYVRYQGYHPDGRPYQPNDWPLARSIMSGEIVTGEEIAVLRGDGTRGYIEASSAPIREDTGRIVAGVVIFTDITERKRAAVQANFLARANEVLASSLDYETTLNNVARLVVPHIADWCAVDMVEAEGQTRRLAVAHVDPDKVALAHEIYRRYPPALDAPRGMGSVLRTGKPELMSEIDDALLVAVARDAEHLRILRTVGIRSYIIVPILVRDRAVGTITFVTAESGRHYVDADLVMAQELARRASLAVENAQLYRDAHEAIREREALLSIASHELKNPLASILGFTALLERRVTPGNTVTEREQRQIRTIKEQAGRLNKMLNMLLDMTRIETGQLVMNASDVDLHQLVSRIVGEVEPSLQHHLISYQEPDVPAIVHGDELRLEQVVHNLLGNAIKYSPAGGEIKVQLATDRQEVCLVVADPGIGIPPDALPRLFQRFSRIQSQQSDRIGGLGLGLYVVKEIVERHGGRIEVSSTEGVGSTFTVRLPARAW